MEKLIKNAESQILKFGKCIITVYPNRDYENSYQIAETKLESAIETISHFYGSSDDISVSHSNSMK